MREPTTFVFGTMIMAAVSVALTSSCGEDDISIATDSGVLEGGAATAVAEAGAEPSAPGPSCARGGASCSSFAECCSGTCAGQLCTTCSAETESCAGDAGACCVGLTCYFDSCRRCAPDGTACVNGTDCCSQICGNGKCQACRGLGAACASETECCPGSTCEAVDGGARTCQPPVVGSPMFAPPPGAYATAQTIHITTTTPNALIYYSTDGADPATPYFDEPGLGFTAFTTTRIRAIAVRTGLRTSPIVEAIYTIGPVLEAPAPPQFLVPPGEHSNPISVGLSTANPYPAAICYTVDGSAPACSQGVCTGTSFQYSPGSPLPVDASPGGGSVVLKALACTTNRPNSSVTEAAYTFRAAAPSANTPSGAVPSGQVVVFSTTTVTTGAHVASLCYTADSSPPACLGGECANGTRIAASSGSVTVTQDTTYRVIACRSRYSASEERTFSYDVP